MLKIIHRRGWSWYAVSTPKWLCWLYPKLVWNVKGNEANKKVYLTFDDGPIPDVTEFVLDELKKNNYNATFFCIGKNVVDHPKIYERILKEGHAVGNHTQNHLSGWATATPAYLTNIATAATVINSKLYRPPYGRIKRNQINALRQQGYNIIMWDILSGDFDEALTGEDCYQNIIHYLKPNSIIVFHDSVKALPRMQYALPKLLHWLKENEYETGVF